MTDDGVGVVRSVYEAWNAHGDDGHTDLRSVVHLVQVRDGAISCIRVFPDEAQATAAEGREAGG